MKTKSIQHTLTAEQIEARKRAESFFQDLMRDTEKPKARAKAKALPPHPNRLNPLKQPQRFTVVARIYRIIMQDCLTCGNTVKYASQQLIRLKQTRTKLETFIEIPGSLPEPITTPSIVETTYEQTHFCPQCVAIAIEIENCLLQKQNFSNGQMELFQ